MKRPFAIALASLLALSVCSMTAYADETQAINVYVTISDANGELALAQEEIQVTDVDNDGNLTINDALYAAHEAKFEGGADAGYASSETSYGLTLSKLWGTENGGSYGYYVNNTAAMQLGDLISDGDYINAFVYTDLSSWSDTYCYFDVQTATAEETLTLTLSAAGYDEQWNPVSMPVEGATITIDGNPTEFVTDSNGSVTITFSQNGTHIISAVSENQVLVPPVCTVDVSGVEEAETTATETTEPENSDTETATESTATEETYTTFTSATATETSSTTTTSGSGNSSPKTGDAFPMAVCIALAAASGTAFLTKRHGK
jgi:hypothetical protein